MAKARQEGDHVIIYSNNNPKPFKIIEGYENGLAVGVTFWGGDQLTDEELKSYGFFDYIQEDFDPRIKYRSSIDFDEDQQAFIATISDIVWLQTLAEMKQAKINNVKSYYNNQLALTDWVIIRDTELGNTTDQSVLDQRAALRTECATKEAEINALTTKKSVVLYDFETDE